MKIAVLMFNLLALLFFLHPPGIILFLIMMVAANVGCYFCWHGDKAAAEREKQVLLSTEKLKGTAKLKRGNL